jgi:16S rRNA (guanine(1405)-N(7))-methyltransferase
MMKVILTAEDVIHQAAASEAYQDIHPDVIRRICETEARKGLKSRELVKSIRSRLHQIGGAYLPTNLNPDGFSAALAALPRNLASPEIQDFCRRQMEQHASTKERLPILDHFFHDILGDLPPIKSVLDLACGLTPLSLPWMPLQPGTSYTAVDMYRRLAASLQTFFNHTGIPGMAAAADIVTYPLYQSYDVVFLLKTLPCLEQQGKGFACGLIDRIQARTIVISYPLRTLGGSRKGLGATYEADFNRLAENRPWQVKRFEFSNELVFRVTNP